MDNTEAKVEAELHQELINEKMTYRKHPRISGCFLTSLLIPSLPVISLFRCRTFVPFWIRYLND